MGNYRHVLSGGFTSTSASGYLLTTAIPYDGGHEQGHAHDSKSRVLPTVRMKRLILLLIFTFLVVVFQLMLGQTMELIIRAMLNCLMRETS